MMRPRAFGIVAVPVSAFPQRLRTAARCTLTEPSPYWCAIARARKERYAQTA
jgi:hypothetical protein